MKCVDAIIVNNKYCPVGTVLEEQYSENYQMKPYQVELFLTDKLYYNIKSE